MNQNICSLLPQRERLGFVRTFRHLLVKNLDLLSDLAQMETQKPSSIFTGELLSTADACRYLEKQAGTILRPRFIPTSQTPMWLWGQADVVHRRPRGVVGIIGTWNYPLLLNAVAILQALVAGNTVIWKPSEVIPKFAAALHSLLLEAGFPPDVIQMLPATRDMGAHLVEQKIDHLMFTGSWSVGKQIAARMGERLITSTLELSGCDAQFVWADADVSLAAKAAWFGVNLNHGQTCIGVRRVLVHDSLYQKFCAQLSQLSKSREPTPTLPSQRQEVLRFIQDAHKHGGRLLLEAGEVVNDAPAIIIDGHPAMAICQEACFSRVMVIIPFGTVEQALALDAACPYALGASLFTTNIDFAKTIAARLRTGMVTINDVILPTSHPATPFGGRAHSGWGVTQGAEGLLEMTVPQVVTVRRGSLRLHYDLSAVGQGKILRHLLFGMHAPSLKQKLLGWIKLLLSMRPVAQPYNQAPPKP